MTDFVKELEKKFNTQIIYSKDHIWENYYDVDKDGNIKTLYLDEVDLKDINVLLPIAGSLVELALTYCNVEVLRPLNAFSRLETLDLTGNHLNAMTLRYLGDLKNLKNLDLGGIGLKDTSLLGDLNGLENLSISGGNPYREINGLEKLKSLQHLNISWSAIESIKKINANENLRSLNIGETDIKRITDLERFPYLEELRLDGGLIKKIEGLDTLQNLKQLFISSTQVKKIEGLESLINLEVLDLSYNQISKIRGLDSLKNLKELSLNENNITKVENLNHLINLEYLTFEANEIKKFDTSFLSDLVSECYISLCHTGDYIKEIRDVPKNVTIKFEDDHFVPRTLYRSKDFFQ
ncbi:leucine-rich repeat domain-containing protein [Chryseobacterium gambrini]|uniref:leucine-rich repeat domain-containing protein n=1 Tax=Chryseobacterium gambrini TaxID=373672 RepID=UPI0022F3C172|nr:leucine-rich repeat domain-containing protein [Chryseobacterium gambrini]WBX98240.1 leucine-rich repeat domain-containing protein [Chryseobacterium gambrini]